jgi:hypothetical protein
MLESLETMLESLDGSRLVLYDEDLGVVFSWNGGHTVRVINAYTGKDVDVFSVGDFARDAAELADVERGIAEYVDEFAA